MSLKLEMKNIGKFFYRRKWLILASITIALFGGFLYNVMAGTSKDVSEGEKTKTVFVSQFSIYLETKQGQPYGGISQFRSMLINEEQQDKISDLGIQISKKELNKSVIMFMRSHTGEVVHVRVKNTNKDYVTRLSNFFYDEIMSDNFTFTQNKEVFSVSSPTKATPKIPVYEDIVATTDKTMMSAETGIISSRKNKMSLIVFVLIGLIAGIILSLIVDIFNKKIYSIGYIESIVAPKTKIIDASFDDRVTFLSKINIIGTIDEREKCLALLQEGSNSRLLEDLQGNEEIPVHTKMDLADLKRAKKVLLLVEKSHTTIDWLTTQVSLLEEIDKKIIVFFYDTYQ